MYEDELKILKTAIINEMEGEHFYRLAAANSQDEEASQAFLFLAAEESRAPGLAEGTGWQADRWQEPSS